MTVARSARLSVRVSPGAACDRILGPHGDALKVAVSAPPERGKANKAVCALVAAQLGVKKRDVRVVSGESSQNKVLVIDGLTDAELSERLARTLVQ